MIGGVNSTIVLCFHFQCMVWMFVLLTPGYDLPIPMFYHSSSNFIYMILKFIYCVCYVCRVCVCVCVCVDVCVCVHVCVCVCVCVGREGGLYC